MIYGIALIGALLAAGVVALFTMGPFDLAARAARHASGVLGRAVTIGMLRVNVGAEVTVELRDLNLENSPGGSEPVMLHLGRVDAKIAPWSLAVWAVTGRPPVVRALSADGIRLLLEHTEGNRPNWRFSDSPPAHGNPRAEFPALLDARARVVDIGVRTSSGRMLRVTLDNAGIGAAGTNQPVTIGATGAYNGTQVKLVATEQSFDTLHDTAVPFGMELHLVSGDTTLDFKGTMTDPLNADGAQGRMTLTAPSLDRSLSFAGVQARVPLPVTLTGDATRSGDLSRLANAEGSLRGHPFHGDFQLREGPRRAPDSLTIDAAFTVLDLTGVPETDKKSNEMTLRIDDDPGTNVDAHITAKQFARGGLRADDAELKLKLSPGALAIAPLALRIAGGAARIDAAIENGKSGVDMRLDAALTGAAVGQLSELLSLGQLPLTGAVDGRAHMVLAGNTMTEAKQTSRGAVLLSMRGGSVERKIIEGVSTDLRMLFNPADGSSQIGCLLGMLDVRGGIARIAPLRIRTAAGTIAAAGALDLPKETIDVVVASESASTGVFALDVPLRVSGPLRNPRVLPAVGGASPVYATADLREMPPDLRDFARSNPCLMGERR